MRIISFNVNGIRSMTGKVKNGEKKGSSTNNCIKTLIEEQRPDILCLQEVKTQNEGDLACFKANFKYIFTNFSQIKKGYSGVALMTNEQPELVEYNFDRYLEIVDSDVMKEGRMILAKFEKYYVITVYVPNSQPELARLKERVAWEISLREYISQVMRERGELPIILCGDLNVANEEIDIHNPKGKSKIPGYSKEEREEMKKLLESGFIDSYRYLHPNEVKYTYWSNFANSRARNVGWRIDYCLVSNSVQDKIIEADCLNEYMGSDHCPVLMDINL